MAVYCLYYYTCQKWSEVNSVEQLLLPTKKVGGNHDSQFIYKSSDLVCIMIFVDLRTSNEQDQAP